MAKQVGLAFAGGFLAGGTLHGVKGGADIAGWTDGGASGTMETITTEQGGRQHGRGGTEGVPEGSGGVLRGSVYGTAEENAGRRETASEYVERIRANTTGAPAQAAGAGERGDVELRQVGNRLYAWETVPEGLQSAEAKETQRLLAEYGIPSEIVSWSQSNANGATSTMRGEASTLQDGTVLVKNHAELTARNMAGHEMAHVAREQAPAAYQAYYDAVVDQVDFSSDTYREMADTIAEYYFTNRGKTFDITTDYAALYEELVGYISGNMLADEAAARRRYAPMFHDFDAVAAAWRDMETAMRQTGRGTAEGGGEYGREKNLLGRYFRRGKTEAHERSGAFKLVGKKKRGSEKTASRVTEKMGGSRAEFDAVRERDLSPKQKAETAIARKYGYTLYHVPAGSEMVLDGEPRVMERTAFTRPGTAIIFARDGTEAQYIHHELFHQFIHGNTHGEMQLLEEMQRQIDYDSREWDAYDTLCKSTYGENVPLDQVYEEITADLCEYAMSGSKTMRERLRGLFPDGALKPLTEQARQVFEANRQAAGGAGGGNTRRGEDRRYPDGRDTPRKRPAGDTRGAGGQPEPSGTGAEPGDSPDPSAPIEPAAAPTDPVTQAAIDGVNGKQWDGEAYELSSRFFHRQDKLLEYTARVEPLEGYQDVACHGSPYSFVNIDADGKEINIPVAEFAKILENSPGFEPGKPIRLLACETGKGEGLPAQYLADYFGVEVMAPDNLLFVDMDGNITIGNHNQGHWRLFKPRKER